jgi:hypothetical protein
MFQSLFKTAQRTHTVREHTDRTLFARLTIDELLPIHKKKSLSYHLYGNARKQAISV